MPSGNHSQVRSQISKIVAFAKKQSEIELNDQFIKFIRLFYAYTSPEDFRDKSTAELYAAAHSHWRLMIQRQPHELNIDVFNPSVDSHGWQSTHSIIEVNTDDMPFLVDSMRMELNRIGITTHLMIFTGGIKVIRDAKGRLQDVLTYDTKDDDANAESPIYMEIDRQNDPEVLQKIAENILRVIDDVRTAVEDWQKMRGRMQDLLEEMHHSKMPQKPSAVSESIAFLEWVLDDNFTFLGTRDYEVIRHEEKHALRLIKDTGLGVLRDDTESRVYREFSELPEQVRELMLSTEQILMISKTNTRSTVHRPAYTDYIGVKRFDENGEFIGERRFIGLYTSTAYSSSPREIPFLRKKVASIMKKSGLPYKSHSGKDLVHILSNLPRDDLFQGTVKELFELAMGILHIQERRRVRLFVRQDAYNRFISCLVYLPRENFNSQLLNRMQDVLMQEFAGEEASFNIHFSESILARIHYILRIDPKNELNYNLDEVEQRLIDIARSWADGFRDTVLDYFGEEKGNSLVQKYHNSFPTAYREVFNPKNTVHDVERMESLVNSDLLEMSFYRPLGAPRDLIKFKLFRLDQTVPLSDALPMLENMGLRVIGEVPYRIVYENKQEVWINDFNMTYAKEPNFEVEDVKTIFQEAFSRVWLNQAENDEFNRLVLEAQLNWREITILRAYTKYLRQLGFTFSLQYVAETMVNNAGIARLIIEMFKCFFDPTLDCDRHERAQKLEDLIVKKLDDVAILDEDRILRRFLDLIHATLRTNYFQVDANGEYPGYLALKINPTKIPEMPRPMPKFEVFVYSPRFEGVHLRADKVARGGIRWSDRREDFRTEILGLMKAQRVKNALIVPAGAKGGFVPKNLPVEQGREAVTEEAISCYKEFIQGLLDITDNLQDGKVIKPINTISYDEDDPYLVVAADKGTATFSDIANQIAIDRGFWLGDAFASGGSTGYDHKKMGITARGAWVSAQRHFQDMGINVDKSEITVVGIGDMSGDVFGNGVLISPHIKLIAAYNHMHIFLDPDPDPTVSHAERERLFKLRRSTWEDYNPKLISKGGGVYSRHAKSITLSDEIREVLGIEQTSMTPNELLKSILQSPVDLIWNGGIGTFVKATEESHEDAGDRSNDAIRVNGNELRARVVCEGGNLGLTQLGRIEYELAGGKVNTDFIDNSAGVDCSDHEVNIKILLNAVVKSGDLTEKQRNQLLVKMTGEVAELVLQNNYHQNLAITLASHFSNKQISLYIRYINALVDSGNLDRAIEFIPEDKVILERRVNDLGLTRPELSVLFAYTKILIEQRIKKSELTNDPYLRTQVQNAFPTPIRKRYSEQMYEHRLSHEIIATQLSNQLVSDMGITFAYQMYDETGAPLPAIVRAYSISREIFQMSRMYKQVEALDYLLDPTIQMRMYDDITKLVRRASRWFLRTRRERLDISETVEHFSSGVGSLYRRLSKILPEHELEDLEQRRDALIAANVPEELATRLASSGPMYHALNIIEAASMMEMDLNHVAKVYFRLVETLELVWFRELIESYAVDDRWSVLAKAAFKGDLDGIQRLLTIGVLKLEVSRQGVNARITAWLDKHKGLVARWKEIVADLRSSELKDFAILSVAVRELSDLAQTSSQISD